MMENLRLRKGYVMKNSIVPDARYIQRIKRFPLKPIRSERENALAAAICDELLDEFDSLSSLERDYFEVLSDLIEKFEERWQEENNIEPLEMVTFLMEQNDLCQTDLISEFGTSSRISEFLAGKRDLSLTQIVKLAARFNLSPNVFMPADDQAKQKDQVSPVFPHKKPRKTRSA